MSNLKRTPSEAQLRANRANAQKSTGPRSVEGKARSARNALKHGITARDLTTLGEDYEILATTIVEYIDSWQPRNPYETALVKNLATLQVRLNRCVRMETGLLDTEILGVEPSDSHEAANSALAKAFTERERNFLNYSRYEANLSRAYDRALKQLLSVRKEKLAPTPPDLHTPSLLDRDKTAGGGSRLGRVETAGGGSLLDRDKTAGGDSRLGRVETAGGGNNTNPISDENKQPSPAAEPNQDPSRATRRYKRKTPIDPESASRRRHGKRIELPEPKKNYPVLVWINDKGEETYPG